MDETTKGEKLQKELMNEKRNGWDFVSEEKREEIFKFSEEYKYFLNQSKTEREVVAFAKDVLRKNQFQDIHEVDHLKAGDRVFFVNRDKSIYIAVIGKEPMEKGCQIIGAHVDSPRLDLKPNPLYEEQEFALFKTHYYGGIKKYQWTTIPLAIHGVIVKPDGEKITVRIGEEESDPVFTVTDLLPHLAQDQMERKLKEGITGEELNLLIGSIPFQDDKVSNKVKLNIMNLLHEKYGIREIDFLSSELEIVPAFKARDLGFDRSMVAAYGQDDKICAYTSLRGILNVYNPEKTAICILSDKEEIGSVGNTGMESHMFDYFVSELLNKLEQNQPNQLEKVFAHSKMLSADVDAGLDPTFSSVSEPHNAARIGYGIGLNKYTGARGKSGASDANAEFVAEVRRLFEEKDVRYQLSELGKVDVGGGGTIAYILANKGIDVIDCGVPVLCMHSPFEITSKYDIFMAYKGYEAFYQNF